MYLFYTILLYRIRKEILAKIYQVIIYMAIALENFMVTEKNSKNVNKFNKYIFLILWYTILVLVLLCIYGMWYCMFF